MRILSAIMTVPLLVAPALATTRPDFSGTWVMDKDRSFSNPAGLDQIMTVVHKGDEVKVHAKLTTPQGERLVDEEFFLDGKERNFTPQGPAPNAKGKRKAHWLPDGRRFVVSDEVTTEGPSGSITTQTTRKWSLSPDGATHTVDYYIDGPRGSFESKRIFVKK